MNEAREKERGTPKGEREHAIRGLLSFTWHAFFARFGRLTAIQRVAIPEIARGAHALVCAPTASGKTEAVIAPLLERVCAQRGQRSPLQLIVISPTRALANDLLRRLRGPLHRLNVSVGLKTGDASFNPRRPPTIVITTPESLDSMLARRPKSLRGVKGVVIDELHLMAGSARGDQLRCLLTRLDHVTADAVQRCAASATMPQARDLAQRFLGPVAQLVEATSDRPQRRILADFAQAEDLAAAAQALALDACRVPGRKIIAFANRRAHVEQLAALLRARAPQLRDRVFVHHGSLARGERRRVEAAFLATPSGVCVATTTLEIGVDIGDVDGVVLFGPPHSVTSLLQRVGRSNRKGDFTRVLCLHRDRFEEARFRHLLQKASEGTFFEELPPFRPTLLVQQALSLLYQNPKRWISAGALRARLPPDACARHSEEDCQSVLELAAALGYIRGIAGGRFSLDALGEERFEKGELHSTIETRQDVEVVNAVTGRVVGRVHLDASAREAVSSPGQRGGVSVSIGGRQRSAARLRGDRLFVRGDAVSAEVSSGFSPSNVPQHTLSLAQDLAAHLGVPPQTLLATRASVGPGWKLAHFLGSVRGQLLAMLLRDAGLVVREVGAFFMFVRGPLPRLMIDGFGSEGALSRRLDRHIDEGFDRLVGRLQPGPFLDCIPRALTHRWLVDALQPRDLARLLATSRVREGSLSLP